MFSAAAGVALTGAYAPLSWFPLAVLVPAAVLWSWRRRTPKAAALSGWVFGLAHFATSFYWVYYSLHDFGEAPAMLAVAATLLFVAALAVYFAALAWAVSCAARFVPIALSCLLLYPSLWSLSEWLRGVLLTGFPWNVVGQAAVDSPLAGVLPVFGATGASWLVVFLAGCLVLAFSRRNTRTVIVAAGAFVAVSVAGAVSALLEWTAPAGERVEVALAQGNVEQNLKFDRDNFRRIVEAYRGLSARALGADLVLWPETAVPAYYDLLEKELAVPLGDEIREAGGEFVLGAFVRDEDGGAYNALVKVASPPQVYRKRHLVPFGEYLPLRGLLNFFRAWILIPMSDLKAGRDRPLMRVGEHDVGVSICYEVSFASEIMDALPEAAYLINVSNDSWFGDSTAPYQHLQLARLRTAETGRAMVRATSTGVSAVIDHEGNVVERSRQFAEQLLTATVEPRRGRTPYSVWGDVPVLAWSLLSVLGLAVAAARRRVWKTN